MKICKATGTPTSPTFLAAVVIHRHEYKDDAAEKDGRFPSQRETAVVVVPCRSVTRNDKAHSLFAQITSLLVVVPDEVSLLESQPVSHRRPTTTNSSSNSSSSSTSTSQHQPRVCKFHIICVKEEE